MRRVAILAAVLCAGVVAVPAMAQASGGMSEMHEMGTSKMDAARMAAKKPLPSPPATASAMVSGASITISYNTPSMRGRKIFGGLVPYGVVWRTGANAATTLVTTANLKIGSLSVPAGKYTLYTMPGATDWKLIVNKQTGQWGTVYHADQDLGRVEMKVAKNAAPVEKMVIAFEHTKGSMTALHVKWADLDLSVPVMVEK